MTDETTTERVVIGIPTYRRVERLRELLPAVADQVLASAEASGPGSPAAGVAAQIVVADNDPDGSAYALREEWATFGVRCVHEPRPGLAAVRNRLLDEAAGAAVIVFIDDDELPGPRWLELLLEAWRRYRPAAVSGPVRSRFAVEPSAAVLASGLFDRVRRPTGTVTRGGASNNLLLDLSWLRSHGLRFDAAFGESGGEDTMLMHTIVDRGGTIRWCDEAEVVEMVPADRLTPAWVRRRIIRTSNSWARVQLAIGAAGGRTLRSRGSVAARVPYFAVLGAARIVRGTLRRREAEVVTGRCDLYRSLGVARAVLGSVSAEYRRS